MANEAGEISNNLERYITRKKATLIILADQFGKSEMTQYAKTHAKWIDRTNNARNGLHGGGFLTGDTIISFIAHNVVYGKYLEKMQGGKYSILLPTTQTMSNSFKRKVENLLKD